MKYFHRTISIFFLISSILNLIKAIEIDIDNHTNWHLVDNKDCGNNIEDKIIGGKEAGLGQFPWMVRIGYSGVGIYRFLASLFDNFISFKCGGVIINNIYVITAAHCVVNLPPGTKLSTIRVGENDADSDADCDLATGLCAPPVQDFGPEEIIVHADYENPPYRNDIALIRLDHSIKYNKFVQPICLPHGRLLNSLTFVGNKGIVAGWGVNDVDFMYRQSPRLLYVYVPIVGLQDCKKAFSKLAKLGDGQICAGGEKGIDSCAGDSGGPLFKAENYDGIPKYYLLGVVSFGNMICGRQFPAVYTSVPYYLKWILKNIKS